MEIKNFTITKRDGSKDRFSLDKIMNAIVKAFESVDEPADLGTISKIISHLDMHDDIKVEDIQNQVEEALMREGFYKVAKSFILYRQEHSEDRETLQKMQFLSEYMDSVNAATGSKYDANANVEHKNIATLIGELPKSNFIRLNRRLLTDRIKKMYGKPLADEYIDKLTHHFIYKNDETSLANYCASITMYPWLIGGTISIGGNSTAPTNLKSFCGGFVNMVFMVSSMLSGACATPEFLMYMNYFIGKEYGQDYWKRADEQADLSLKKRTIDKVITDYFEQIVYTLNQPTGARNYQAVFWNIAYYDRYYFESIFGEFYFPDGSKPDWDGLSWLQKRFMKWFNKERTKTLLTFPVETMALLTDENGECKDKEWGDFTAEMYSEGHSFFTYMSDNADSLSPAAVCATRLPTTASATPSVPAASRQVRRACSPSTSTAASSMPSTTSSTTSSTWAASSTSATRCSWPTTRTSRSCRPTACCPSSTPATSTSPASTSPSASTDWSRLPSSWA